MSGLIHLFENNRRWVATITARDPEFFQRLAGQQTPKYLWIGCADSRVPANQIVGLLPGELFVHRNVSNVVAEDDPNCLCVIQYAVDVLRVEHIIVCGHFGCGGIQAALENRYIGQCDGWLDHIRRIRDKHRNRLDAVSTSKQFSRLCALNVIEQVLNVTRTGIVQEAWGRQQPLSIHGWIYSIGDGLLQDLGVSIRESDEALKQYEDSIRNLVV